MGRQTWQSQWVHFNKSSLVRLRQNLLLRAVKNISDSSANFVTEICPQLSGKISDAHRCLWLTWRRCQRL